MFTNSTREIFGANLDEPIGRQRRLVFVTKVISYLIEFDNESFIPYGTREENG